MEVAAVAYCVDSEPFAAVVVVPDPIRGQLDRLHFHDQKFLHYP